MFDEEGYRKLALHVLARAVKDCQRDESGRPINEGHRATEVYDSYTLFTAQSFLTNITNDRLLLWCAWLGVDPKRVCRIYTSVYPVGRRFSSKTETKPDS